MDTYQLLFFGCVVDYLLVVLVLLALAVRFVLVLGGVRGFGGSVYLVAAEGEGGHLGTVVVSKDRVDVFVLAGATAGSETFFGGTYSMRMGQKSMRISCLMKVSPRRGFSTKLCEWHWAPQCFFDLPALSFFMLVK